MMIERLVLGTAQLGMPYGINNKIGKPDSDRVNAIVKIASENGVTRFDTAQAYGNSEEVLGKAFDQLGLATKVRVYTKLSQELDLHDAVLIEQSVDESLRKLKVDCLEGLFLHREEGLDLWDSGLHSALCDLIKQGKVRTIGASFYTPEKALKALDLEGIDLIQVPANIFDRRFETVGVFKKARDLGKQIFVRSVFLQGLLLMPTECVPAPMSDFNEPMRKLSDLAKELGVSRQELAIDHVKRHCPDCFFVVGAEDDRQVAETARLFRSNRSFDVPERFFENIPENVLNPALWPRR